MSQISYTKLSFHQEDAKNPLLTQVATGEDLNKYVSTKELLDLIRLRNSEKQSNNPQTVKMIRNLHSSSANVVSLSHNLINEQQLK